MCNVLFVALPLNEVFGHLCLCLPVFGGGGGDDDDDDDHHHHHHHHHHHQGKNPECKHEHLLDRIFILIRGIGW
jgi:hypothetical protein